MSSLVFLATRDTASLSRTGDIDKAIDNDEVRVCCLRPLDPNLLISLVSRYYHANRSHQLPDTGAYGAYGS
jgi:hypothetical protein